LPVPKIKKGKWSKERERTKSGRWRKKRSDANQPKKPKHSSRKYVITVATCVAIIVVVVVLYFLFPELFNWIKI
jgi:hypothetical protein